MAYLDKLKEVAKNSLNKSNKITILNEQDKFEVPMLKDKVKKLKTNIPPEKRTFENLPRYSNKKPKVRFQDWLMLKTKGSSVGQSPNKTWFGWSHRAIGSFKIGDTIKPDTIGNNSKKTYKIKTDEEAMNCAIRFAKEIS